MVDDALNERKEVIEGLKEIIKKKDDEIDGINQQLVVVHIKEASNLEKIKQLEKENGDLKIKRVQDVEVAVAKQKEVSMICASKVVAQARREMYLDAQAAGFTVPKWDLDLAKWESNLNDEEASENDEEVDQLMEEMDQVVGNIGAQTGERVEATIKESEGGEDGVPKSNEDQA